eukprot:TRINITY_DN8735_c0_g1_i1.p1 TRINITY_DN8735_c0_g1~~TRINITY_DN8735_c0_g1_i1.p1  ORF type:complete len:122 (+),score=17.29 TRINITY_DN8735_c0_g1_i1:152-517(+)
MFFTFCEKEKIIIYTTPKGVKYNNICQNPHVAVLLHCFEGQAASNALLAGMRPVSATIYGKAKLVDENEREHYQKIQMDAHPEWAKSFQGPDKAIITVPIDGYLIVDVKGKEHRWQKNKMQ